MRSLRLFSVLLLLAFLVACPTLWEEEKEDDPQPVPPTITGHEFESSNSIDNEHVSIRLHYEGAVSSTVELHRSAPDDGDSEFYQMRNLDGDSGEVIDDGSTHHHGRPRWGRSYVYRMAIYANSGDLVWSESDDYVVETPPFLPPENVVATLDETGNTITVTWDPCSIEHDVTYRVYRATYDVDPSEIYESHYTNVRDVETTLYRDNDVSPGTRYAYTVTTICNEWGQTPRSAVAVPGAGGGDVVTVPSPEGLSATETDAGDGILVSWEAVTGADAYKVYRATGGSDASYSAISDWLEDGLPTSGAVSYTDTTAVYGTTYYYCVTARANEIESEQSAYVQGILGTAAAAPPKPENVSAQQHYDGTYIDIQWDAVPGATRYRVYRLASSETADPADIASYTEVHETATGADPGWHARRDNSYNVGRLYYYRVSAVTDHGESVSDDWGQGFFGSELTKPSRPTENLTATEDTYSNAIVVSWDAVDDAAFYRVYSRGGSHVYIEATEEFAVSDWISGTQFVHMTAGDGNDQAYYKIQARHAWGGVSYVSVGFMGSVDPAAPAYTADDGDGDGDSGDGGDDGGDTGGAGSWVTLESGLPANVDITQLAVHDSEIFALFVDEGDSSSRLRAMKHSGVETANWSVVGDYLSVGAVISDYGYLYSDGSNLYAVYADTEEVEQTETSAPIFVKRLTGSSWSAVGSADGVSVEDPDTGGAITAWGSRPFLTTANSQPFMVYTTSSFMIIDSLSYPGSGDYWTGADSAFWYDPNAASSEWISGETIGAGTDSSGRPIASVEGGRIFSLYRYDGSSWSELSSQDESSSAWVTTFDFLVDESDDNVYIAYETYDAAGEQIFAGVRRYDGSSWADTDLISQVGAGVFITDISLARRASGNGFVAAVAYRNSSIEFFLETWEYDGSTWSQIGPAIDLTTSGDALSLVLDSGGRPIIAYREGSDGAVQIAGYRE